MDQLERVLRYLTKLSALESTLVCIDFAEDWRVQTCCVDEDSAWPRMDTEPHGVERDPKDVFRQMGTDDLLSASLSRAIANVGKHSSLDVPICRLFARRVGLDNRWYLATVPGPPSW